MTADRPRPRPATGTGRHRPAPAERPRRRPEPARTGDTGPARRLREPREPAGGGGYDRPDPGPHESRRGVRREDPATQTVRLPWPDRALRGLAGFLAGGLVVLALGVLVVWIGADRFGLPGPGADMVIGHGVGAVAAVVGQRIADRRPDRTGTIAAVAVVAIVAFVLGFAWFL